MSEKWKCSSRQCSECVYFKGDEKATCDKKYCSTCLHIDEYCNKSTLAKVTSTENTEEVKEETTCECASVGSSIRTDGWYDDYGAFHSNLEQPNSVVVSSSASYVEETKSNASETKTVEEKIEDQKAFLSEKDIKEMQKAQEGLLDAVREIVPEEILRKENPTDEDKQKIKDSVQKYLENEYLKRYSLDKINLEEEYERIKVKNSRLSRSQRDAVVGYFLIFKWGPVVQKKLDKLQHKENRTKEEEDLLQAILGTTKLEEAYKSVEEANKKQEETPAQEETT